jgi:hypothetical protein
MILYRLPVPDGTYQIWSVRVKIGGVDVDLKYRWNRTALYWTLDVLLTDGTPLVVGQVIFAGKDLLSRATDTRRPVGGIFCARQPRPGLTEFQPGDMQYVEF